MRRFIRNLIICLVLGIALNVLVAWFCSWRLDPETRKPVRQFKTADQGPAWIVDLMELTGAQRAFISTHRYPDARDIELPTWGSATTPRIDWYDSTIEIEQACGWPMPAFWCRLDTVGTGARAGTTMPAFRATWRTRPDLGGFAMEKRGTAGVPSLYGASLPFWPIWPGILVNSLMYFAIAWLGLFGPFLIRRGMRRWSGKCAACGYPVGTSAVCTECGKAVRQRHRSAMSRSTSSKTRI